MALPLDQLTRSKDSPLRFQPVSQQDRQKLGQSGQEVQRFRDVRQKLESNAAVRPAGALAKEPAPARMPLTRSPIAAKPVAELGRTVCHRRCTKVLSRISMCQPRQEWLSRKGSRSNTW